MSFHRFQARNADRSTDAAAIAPAIAPCTIGLLSQSMCLLLVLPRPRPRRLPRDGRRHRIDCFAQHALLLLTDAPREVFARQSDPPRLASFAHGCQISRRKKTCAPIRATGVFPRAQCGHFADRKSRSVRQWSADRVLSTSRSSSTPAATQCSWLTTVLELVAPCRLISASARA